MPSSGAGEQVGVPRPPGASQRLTPEDFASLFEGSSRVLWLIAAGVLGGPAMADDVLQDAALVALGKLDEFDPATNFVAWMGQIVRFTALNEARRTRRRKTDASSSSLDRLPERGSSAGGSSPVTSSGTLGPDGGDFDDRLLGAIRDLNETARASLLLRVVLDMPYSEIALALDIPEGTAMSHVHRSRRALRTALSGAGSPAHAQGGAHDGA